MTYFLHQYGRPLDPLKSFSSRRALRAYMRKMCAPAPELADKYYLFVRARGSLSVYDFVSCGEHHEHLKAVLSKKVNLPLAEGAK